MKQKWQSEDTTNLTMDIQIKIQGLC